MGAAAGPISAVSSIASTGLSAIGLVTKSQGENAADQAQAARLDQAAQYGRAAADETDAQLRENLAVQLDNIDVVRAAAGIDPSSPTTAALRDRTTQIADRARSIQVGNIRAQADQNSADADYLRSAGAYALKIGQFNAGAAIAKGIAGTNFGSFGVG